jgi:hypothetical protein
MPLPTESVSLAGSGLVFQNYYGAGVTDAFRTAIITAEHDLESHITDHVTVLMSFDMQALNPAFSAENNYNLVHVSYATYVAALKAHATIANDLAAIAGLPATDPSNGLGFDLPQAQARMLGLAQSSFSIDDAVVLNSLTGFNFGQDAVGAIEHEMTEGVFGRVSSLGVGGSPFEPMDLFRFTAQGVRDYTGGADGQAAFFGIDSADVTNLQFHNSINSAGVSDGFDLADWDHTVGDAFGPNGVGSDGSMSATDLQILDILGWTPASSTSSTSTSGTASATGAGATGSSTSTSPTLQQLQAEFSQVFRETASQALATPTVHLADGTSQASPAFTIANQLVSFAAQLDQASATPASIAAQIVSAAAATTSVATLSYEFFTGQAPSAAGMDYLVSPTGPNANNLNSAYYQSFSLENRYINFAVNLGTQGAGAAAFNASYGGLDLADATAQAYATIFGSAPTAAKVDTLLNTMVTSNGVTETRAQYFADFGQDGQNGIGTKAAMVGWLLAEAEKADVGTYAQSNDAFLTDVALHNASYGVDIVGVYSQASFAYHGS